MEPLKSVLQKFLPSWLFDCDPDPAHAHRRRFTSSYRRKRECVKSLWIGSGLLMVLLSAAPGLVLALAMATTFASFCILDETD